MAHVLRLLQTRADAPDTFNVRLELETDGGPRRAVTVRVTPGLTDAERNEIRWYMEDYLEHPFHPWPQIAARVEGRMAEVGKALFNAVFQVDRAAADFWARIRDQLKHTRIEISTTVQDAAAIPWELLRDPVTDQPLALDADEFVRVQSEVAREAAMPRVEGDGQVRVLLVICRPGGEDDVGFRSVASRLVKGLTSHGRERVLLDVLRPPTFERLGQVLEQANEAGRPYHVVHFDGHGLYADRNQLQSLLEAGAGFNPNRLDAAGTGAHGYLAFEKPGGGKGLDPVGGTRLGALLWRTGVPVLVLNACRSAHAEGGVEEGVDEAAQIAAPSGNSELVRAYGSLAQEVVDQGVAGVVAMRYNVYVVTAAQFVGELYESLAGGRSLGRAVAWARRNLAHNPARHVYEDPIDLQDWPVPVVFEAAPIALFPPTNTEGGPIFAVSAGAAGLASADGELPAPPPIGFFGRDETLLAIDRAFDRHGIVLLHAYAGSGKTTTAAEFARWYRDTGGVGGGIVLFDSFQVLRTVKDLVDKLGGVFAGLLEANNIHWLSLDDDQRRGLALEILRKVPLLWVWDNVEPVAGFPAGTPSLWTHVEQKDLVTFLHELSSTKAKVLLTSRRDEMGWLGAMPVRVRMPPMPRRDRRQVAEELVRLHNRDTAVVKELEPLLEFSAGNPMTLTIVVGQALREGQVTRAQVEKLVARLRAGEAAFDDAEAEGRDKSLGASLSYGFDRAFSPLDRQRLALLYLFQGLVDVDALRIMGGDEIPGCVEVVKDLTREDGVALLDRAVEIGLLHPHGGGYYGIHPALPWFLKTLFARYHGEAGDGPAQAYAWSMGVIGNAYATRIIGGHHDALGMLRAEEQNLLQACRLARTREWIDPMMGVMQGLGQLYITTGRCVKWQNLVDDAIPLVTAKDGGPIAGREDEWGAVIEYRVGLAEQRRDWPEVVHLLRLDIDVSRRRAQLMRDLAVEALTGRQRNVFRSLAASLLRLGAAFMEQKEPESVDLLTEAYGLCRHIGDTNAEAISAFNLGHAYLNIPALRDLDRAEEWYRTSLGLRDEHDTLGLANSQGQLGRVALDRYDVLRNETGTDRDELRRQWKAAEAGYLKALDLIPKDALDNRAVLHGMLALVYDRDGQVGPAISHYQKAVAIRERFSDKHGAGRIRVNLALLLAKHGKFDDALAFARAARTDFAAYGVQVADDAAKADRLIAAIEQDIAAQNPGAAP